MKRLLPSILALMFLIQFGFGQTIATDYADYPPGSTVQISGSGFQANESISLQVLHILANGDNDSSPAHQPWSVTADAAGNVASSWFVPFDQDELGATLKLTADGASGSHAETTFTDAFVLDHTPIVLPKFTCATVPGGPITVTTTITPIRDANGTATISYCATGVPAGVTVSFSPNNYTAVGNTTLPTTTMTIVVSAGATISDFSIRIFDSGPPSNATCTGAGGDFLDVPVSLVAGLAEVLPKVVCPSNKTVNTDANVCTAVVNYMPTISDATTVAYAFAGATTGSGSGTGSGSTFNKGETTVTITTTNACGTTACSFKITVVDNTPPVLTAGANQNVNLDANCQITVPNVKGTATDNCTGVTIVQSPVAGTLVSAAHNGTVNVTVTATDGAGLTDVKTVVLTAKDVTAPILTAGANQNVNLDANCQITVPNVKGTATDNCTGVTIVQSPVAGTLVSAAHNGTVNVTVTATDGAGLTDVKTVVLTAKDVTLPTIMCPNNIVSGATDAGLCTKILSVGTAVGMDNCTGVSVVGVRSDAAMLSAPYPLGLTTITWTATDAAGNKATCQQTVTINQVTTTTTVSVAPTTQQYSDKVTFTANVTACSGITIGGTVTFKVGTQTMGTVNVLANGSATLTAALLETVLGQMSPGSKTVTATFSGSPSYTASSGTTPLTITQEDAGATYTGMLFVSTSSITSSTANVTLSATIQDITAFSPLTDPNAGDIRKATVTFLIDGVACAGCSNLPIALVNPADMKTGTVVVPSVILNIGSADALPFTVTTVVNGYYTGSTSAVITVAKPLPDFVTGGGYLILTNSAGSKAGDAGTRNNYGFNIKYNKSGKSLQGNVNSIFRRTEGGILKTFQLKGNAMITLSVVGINASYTGKASLVDITNPMAPINLGGNLIIRMDVTDNGEPGTNDQVAISVFDGSFLLFSSNWSGTTTTKKTIAAGNIKIHSSSNIAVNSVASNNSSANVFAEKSMMSPDETIVLDPQLTTQPSRTDEKLTLFIEDFNNGDATVQLYDLMQRVQGVWKTNVQNNKGQLEIDLSNQIPGVYILVVDDATKQQKQTKKVIKVEQR
jgi:Bacterial Ig-like domain (group 3)/HYR domain